MKEIKISSTKKNIVFWTKNLKKEEEEAGGTLVYLLQLFGRCLDVLLQNIRSGLFLIETPIQGLQASPFISPNPTFWDLSVQSSDKTKTEQFVLMSSCKL